MLNDEYLNEIKDTVIDETLIPDVESPLEVNPTTNETRTIASVESMDSGVKNLVRKLNDLYTLKTTRDDISTKGVINRLDAGYINEVFEGILNTDLALEEFTQLNSKTNFYYAVKKMNDSIALSQESLDDEVKSFIDSNLSSITVIVNELVDKVLPDTVEAIKKVKELHSHFISSIPVNKNLVVACKVDDGVDFINLLTTPLKDIDFTSIQIQGISKDLNNLNQAKERLLKSLDSSRVYTEVVRTFKNDTKEKLSGFDLHSSLLYPNENICFKEIVKFLDADDSFTDFEATAILFKNDITALEVILKTYNGVYRDGNNDVDMFISNYECTFQCIADRVRTSTYLCYGLQSVIVNSSLIINFLKSL